MSAAGDGSSGPVGVAHGDITAAAIRAVNAPEVARRDYDLDPAGKIALMTPDAAPLVAVLSDRALAPLIDSYKRDDKAAGAAQKRQRQSEKTSLVARYGVVVIGLPFLALPAEWTERLGPVAVVVQLGFLLVSLMLMYYLKTTQPFIEWMQARSRAEVQRVAFFDAVARRLPPGMAAPTPAETAWLTALQLEFFVRYALEPQLGYFRKRSGQLLKSAGLTPLAVVGLAAVILYTIFQLVIGIGAELGAFNLTTMNARLSLAQGMIGSAIAILLLSSTTSRLDQHNGLRYRQTAANLETLAGAPLMRARDAAATGDRAAVLAFVTLANEQIGFGAADWLPIGDLSAVWTTAEPQRPVPELRQARRFLDALKGE